MWWAHATRTKMATRCVSRSTMPRPRSGRPRGSALRSPKTTSISRVQARNPRTKNTKRSKRRVSSSKRASSRFSCSPRSCAARSASPPSSTTTASTRVRGALMTKTSPRCQRRLCAGSSAIRILISCARTVPNRSRKRAAPPTALPRRATRSLLSRKPRVSRRSMHS